MKKFDIPAYYKSSFIASIKESRRIKDPRKKDYTPTKVDFGSLQVHLARHFGFCYGVENAIEISYRTVEENQGKRVFLLSQMIHNPVVNQDLQDKGISFIMDTEGNHFIEFDELTKDDVVIIPAFGTTLEIEQKLKDIGIQIEKYNTTCPFVEKVWTASQKLGRLEASIVIHGKASHEETRASFSHAKAYAPSVIINDMKEAMVLGEIIAGKLPVSEFHERFQGRYSEDFDPKIHLTKLGVVNQTTMLASDTHAIALHLKEVMIQVYGEDKLNDHFVDTRDTLCYATNDNQNATIGLLEEPADFAIVVGGYNSSNTSHLVELCEEKLPSYFISGPHEILSENEIRHFMWRTGERRTTKNWLPKNRPLRLILTAGASCPDTLVDAVLDKIIDLVGAEKSKEDVLSDFS